jgi:hypothetical protein
MARSLTWFVSLPKFFPADRPLSGLMARLLVLWQDLLYEEAGILQDDGFPALDERGNSQVQRRLYFLRGNSRTLVSARYLLDALVADPTFSGWLKEDAALSADFFAAKESFDRHRQAVEHVRNTIGAHAEQDLGKAIAAFRSDDQARFEIHEDDLIRPHLATEILLAALMGDVASEKRLEAYRVAVKPLAAATGAMIRALSLVAGVYMERLRLLPK